MPGPLPLHVGDTVRMRKPHPCGGLEWAVSRVGADIGLTCATCGRRIMLPRAEAERRIKAVVHPEGEPHDQP
jgi:hypothetical protein